MTSSVSLTDQMIDRLQTLIELNTDSVDGYEEAKTLTDDTQLSTLFADVAANRRHNAAILAGHVTAHGRTPDDAGSLRAALHRRWMDLRAKLQGDERQAILAEVVRGEKVIKQTYEEAIENTVGLPVNAVLREQSREIALQHRRAASLAEARA